MTTIDGRWVLLAALLGALALVVPAVTAGGTEAILHGPSPTDGANDSTTDWPATHHHGAYHADGEYHEGAWDDHDQYHPHDDTYGPHHQWNGTDRDEYDPHHGGTAGPYHDGTDGPHDAWNGTRNDPGTGSFTDGPRWGHSNGRGC
ncbi:MAG TPA: hypothetical protein VJ898_10490 [Natrialbaceae archaeon]|nr:hypothetical protein [Natrialbaceae archaeon]